MNDEERKRIMMQSRQTGRTDTVWRSQAIEMGLTGEQILAAEEKAREQMKGICYHPDHKIDERLDQFLQKGPVCIPSVDRKIWSPSNIQWVKQFITEHEYMGLLTAQNHAEMGEGRGEWDDIATQIRERLNG